MSRSLRVSINDRSDLSRLRVGQPYIVNDQTMAILEEPFAFLDEKYVKNQSRSSRGTWRAAAYDLAAWLEYLDAIDLDWKCATREDLIDYRDLLLNSNSPQTGQAYAGSTIKNRMIVIVDFYDFSANSSWYHGTLHSQGQAAVHIRVPIDRDALAHTRNGETPTHRRIKGLYPKATKKKNRMRPFTFEEWKQFTRALGPLPSEQCDSDRRPSRDRLICEFGGCTGARVDAIRNLKVQQFLSLRLDASPPAGQQFIEIRNKGGEVISIAVPTWLVDEIILYIEGERQKAIKAGNLGKRQPTALFLAGTNNSRCGQPLSSRRYQQIVSEKCIEAGLTEIRLRDDGHGNWQQVVAAKHSVHDFRHTYVCWHYSAATLLYHHPPWKEIQTQLGHKSVETTIETYGSCVGQFQKLTRPVDVRLHLAI